MICLLVMIRKGGVMKEKLIVVLTVVMCVLVMDLHSIEGKYYRSESGYLWLCGIQVHGSIIIDLIIWSMLIIQFVIMIMVLGVKNDSW